MNDITKWYTGKSLATVKEFVLPTLAQAMVDGYWQPGTSRKVRAALNKQAVAARFAHANERSHAHNSSVGRLCDVQDNRDRTWESKARGWEFVHAMMFGIVSRAPALVELGAVLEPHCANDAERAALATARQWASDFAPVARVMDRLDAIRPKPVLVMGSLSRLVLDNVGRAMGVDLATVAAPPIEWVWREVVRDGKTIRVPVGHILWPEGTRHGVSRFASGGHQCEACGHGIRTNNWCPLVAQTPDGPVSLWVGRDCARKLFAVEIKGEATFEGQPGPREAA